MALAAEFANRVMVEHVALRFKSMKENSMEYILRVVLFLTGCVIVWLGLNVGLGGIETLGWQGSESFLRVTDPEVFAVRDNHVRFIAGVWMTVGLMLLTGAVMLRPMRAILIATMVMVFVGGLMRLSSADVALLSSAEIAPSLLGELVVFPFLGLWIFFATREPQNA